MIQNRKQACLILGIKENATLESANQKYREYVKKIRPDLNDNEEIVKKFIQINEAINYIRENSDNYPIYPVEFTLSPMEKIKRKIKNLNIYLSSFQIKSFKCYKRKNKKRYIKTYSKKKFA